MGKAELFEMKFWGPAIRFFHAFPLHKDRTDTAAIKHCLRLLELGECVCIFPEGGITAGDGIYPLERGLTLLLRRANPQVVCVGLSGTKSFMSGGSMDLGKSNTEITIRWGEPKQFGEFAGDAALDEIRRILSELSGLPLKDP
jgi:1-acyl-sn-glycerol-3-phosphate acyltransferase